MDTRNDIALAISAATGIDAAELLSYIEIPPDSSMGDYAFPCFRFAKVLRMAPPKIAEAVAAAFDAPETARVEAVNGYLNFFLNRVNFAKGTLENVLVSGENNTVLSYNDMYEMDLESYYTTGTANYSFQAENAITSGIAKVTRTEAYQLYELTGHGETALTSDFTETLNNAGVTVTELNLVTSGSIPADAGALLINAPGADLTDAEAALLNEYVANGGKLFVTTDFTTGTPNLDSVLADCGMARQPGLLIETDTDHYPYGYPQTYLLPKLAGNDITAGVSQSMMIYTPIAQGITTNDDSEFAFTDLLTTGDNAYAMENYATAETAQKADTDPEGCFAVAVAADNSATGARVVWVNCPNLLESSINQAVSGGNAQFLGSVVNWMNGEQTTAVINAKSMSAASLSVPTSAAIPLGVLFTLVLPIVCLIAGAVICVVRRRR